MHLTVRCAFAAGLIGLSIAGCSSDTAPGTGDGGEQGSGGKGTGGKGTGAAGSGGAPAMMCAADTHGDGCRKCLAGACCSDYTACAANAACSKAFDDQAACVAVTGSEVSMCFGDLTRAIMEEYGDSEFPPILDCFIRQCSAVCGGPGAV